MTIDQAKKLIAEIERKAESCGQYVDIRYVKTPQLKDIIITVSVRVKEK